MLYKVKLLDKKLINEYFIVLSIISLLSSFAFLIIDIPDNNKKGTGIALILFLLILYILLWVRANLSNRAILIINNSTLEVKVGDIFQEKEFKVIAFNEYFDTQVDNKIISDKTLNGMYIKKMVKDVDELDNLMSTSQHEKILEHNRKRRHGKKSRYKLGTIFQHNNFLLTAFTKFDNENRAYLYINDYINFLLNFWNEIDIIYNCCSVSIPLLGSGITRFKEYNMVSEQELLELLIWSFKVSKIKFTYPSQVSILIHESKKDKINFYKLKEC